MAAMPGALVRQSARSSTLSPMIPAAPQTYYDAEGAHVHEGVNQQVDHEADVAVSISRD